MKVVGGGEPGKGGRRAAPVLLPDQFGAFLQRAHTPQLSEKSATKVGIFAYHSIVDI